MEKIDMAMEVLEKSQARRDKHPVIPFKALLSLLLEKPEKILRNAFQVFHDMIKYHVGSGHNEYPEDSENVGFFHYDCTSLFVDQVDHPFFADRIFANRLINLAENMKSGVQQNKIYIFDGPPGCGKSTFLNNVLSKFEDYANTEHGFRYETVWRLNWDILEGGETHKTDAIIGQLANMLLKNQKMVDMGLGLRDSKSPKESFPGEWSFPPARHNYLEVGCPSHDHPILMIPKEVREPFLKELFRGHAFKGVLEAQKEYEWLFHENPCNICTAMFEALLTKLESIERVLEMVHARPYKFNRRLGEGISVFNPGDKPLRQNSLSNDMIQYRINQLFGDSIQVQYVFSRFAKTNNGIYALMDIKSYNTERLIELHNIISEGVHKVEYFEENVNSLFLAVMNPEDKQNIKDFPSFSDRIQYVDIPYVMDYKTEVEIYRHIFGSQIEQKFLPKVLENFARVVISTRLDEKSMVLKDWIKDPKKYKLYCDENLQLLKMDLYTGYIPSWLSEEDRKGFTAKKRQMLLDESKKEGKKGFSGRDSIKTFGEFYSIYAREDKPINMSMLTGFFIKKSGEKKHEISKAFLDSLVDMYDYHVLQEVKESLYYYNEEQIARDIQNYVFALNFEIGTVEKCVYTGERLEITEEFLENIENRFLGASLDKISRKQFRKDVLKGYTSGALTQEILMEGRNMVDTELFKSLHEKYVHNLKQKVLDPFLENENFRRAIMDYGQEGFKTYDTRIRHDVTFLITNLVTRYKYNEKSAQGVCIYVIDQDLTKKFKTS